MITNVDFAILDFIAEHFRCGFLDAVVPVITSLGNGGWFWIALAVLLLIPKKTRKYGVAMAIALILDLLLCNVTLKPLVARIRPYDIRTDVELIIAAPHDYSFPSGHTAASFAAAGALWFMKAKGRVPAILLAAVIGLTRLYLYVHYPTDVLCGALLGIVCGFLGAILTKKLPFFRETGEK